MINLSLFLILFIIPFVILLFTVPVVIIGIYVYRDAKNRRMNAFLWTVVAVLAPSFIGLIAYLIVRGGYSNLKCPCCNAPVMEEYVVCPRCGAKLKPACPNCAASVEPNWKLCPMCAQHLPEQYDCTTAVPAGKEHSLWKILIVVIAVPLLLIITLLVSVIMLHVNSVDTSTATMSEITLEELYGVQQSDTVKGWIEQAERHTNKAYALQYTDIVSDQEKEYYYLIYVPGASYAGFSSGSGMNLRKNVLTIDLWGGEPTAETVYYIVTTSKEDMTLMVNHNGEGMECEIIKVDFNPLGSLDVLPQTK